MLENELNDREPNDNATAGRGAGELNPGVPAAVFQPPQVVFQPPPARPDPASAPRSEPARSESARSEPARSESARSESARSESARSEPARSESARQETASPGQAADGGAGNGGGTSGSAGDDDEGTGTGRRRRRRSNRGRGRNGDQDAGDGQPEAQSPQEGDGSPEAEADQPEAAQGETRRSSRTRSRRTRDRDASADSPSAGDAAAASSADSEDNGDAAASGSAEDEAEGAGGVSGRRRRRKRRRGSAEAGSDTPNSDDPPDTVVHVREPNGSPAGSASSDVRSVKGSTRLEAKKQRRREGRETGRRRPPIVTESEFLARRESVERTMVVRQRKERTQIAVLEDGVLVEHYVNRSTHQSYVGNVYLGKVQNVLPSMEAAFVDVGKGRNAVLYAGEVNFDVSGLEGQPKRIESALKAGQSLTVQVTKDPVGHKGARLTSQVSLPGRYLVYVPGASMTGISRKLPDTERNRLKQILKKVMPENAGVIVRTAAEGAAEEELARDVSRLAAQWEAIEKKAKTASAPALLYSEPDLTIRVIRDVFNEDFSQLVVSGDDAWDVVDEYVKYVAPHLADRLTRWDGERDVFAEYRIDEQLAKALERKVWLPSGGSLVIDKTEAMTVVDVNTGKFTGQGGNLEETVTRNNLEAAEEIVRQLRLRDVGGIVVIDFIDMVLESNRELVLRRLLECLARDRTKHQVAEVTSLGLVQMTRKRVGAGLLEAFSTPCECCNGRGVILTFDPDADSHASPHTHLHSRGLAGNGGNGGNGGRGPSPATIAARARAAEASQPADAPAAPEDAPPAPADVPAVVNAPAVTTDVQAASAADAQAADGQPGAAPQDADSLALDAPAQTDNGQAPDTAAEPARSASGRRRRRKPAATTTAPTATTTTAPTTTTTAPTTTDATATATTPAASTPAAVPASTPAAVPAEPAAPEAPQAPEAPAPEATAGPDLASARDGAA
jgi:ribonuclease E